MRLIQLSVPADQQDSILDVLQRHDLGYTVTAGAGEQDEMVQIEFLVPADGVEHVLEDLQAAGYDKDTYTVSIDAEFAKFEDVDAVQNRWNTTPNRLAPDALRSKAKDMRRNSRAYLWMMILSAVVATAGLFIGSPAIVVGSMVIAPIVSPVMTASVGFVRDDREMFVSSIHMQVYGLGVAVVAAAALASLFQQFQFVPTDLAIDQLDLISIRIAPGTLSFIVGLSAGAAGAYGLATKGDVTIVGVMIAAALIPTAAAAGIGIAWGMPAIAVGALLLLVLSVISVNIGGVTMLYYLEYRPDNVDEGLLAFAGLRKTAVLVLTIGLVVGTVLLVGGLSYQQSEFERGANTAINDVIGGEEYEDLSVRDTTMEYNTPIESSDTTVTVTVARESDNRHPELPNRLDRAISDQTGEGVTVEIHYVDLEQSTVAAHTNRYELETARFDGAGGI